MQSVPITTKVVSSNPVRVLDTTLCYKVNQWLATCRWFSPGIPVSSSNKTGRHDTTEILLKVALNTIIITPSRTTALSVCSVLILENLSRLVGWKYKLTWPHAVSLWPKEKRRIKAMQQNVYFALDCFSNDVPQLCVRVAFYLHVENT